VPFDDTHFYLPPDLVSLYGTELWNSMTRQQQVRLSMHEASSTLAQGLWFENILSFKLLSYLYRANPQEPHFYWMLQEIADECRHSMMFGEFIRRSGTPWYEPNRLVTYTANFTRFVAPKVSVFVGVLAAEATTDYLNRRVMQDPECHPIMRQIARIHVIEEARHLGYARHWLDENYAKMPLPMRVWIRMQAPIVTMTLLSQLVNTRVYEEVGLPPDAASLARRNPARRRFWQMRARSDRVPGSNRRGKLARRPSLARIGHDGNRADVNARAIQNRYRLRWREAVRGPFLPRAFAPLHSNPLH